ncbi:UNVERIFIED_CONTAM: hypothetical protein HDU68_011311 [Siphonaria sp. JEL0065]|nr:hypothetical protein HDU68_011311 [Siphonaria sp. JEL0065]
MTVEEQAQERPLDRPPSSVEAALSELVLNLEADAEADVDSEAKSDEDLTKLKKKNNRNTLSFFGFGPHSTSIDAQDSQSQLDQPLESNSKRLSSVVMGLRSSLPNWKIPGSSSEKSLTVAGVKLDDNVKKEMDHVFENMDFKLTL